MVISCTILNLLIVSINILTNRLRCTEVERCTLYEANFTCRNTCLINREIVVCIDFANQVVDSWGRVGNT